MKKKELAEKIEAYQVGMRTTFEDVTAYFRAEIQRLDNAVIERSDDVTEKLKDLSGSLRRLGNDQDQFKKLMTTQLEAALKNNTQASKNMKDLHQTQVDIKDEVEALKLTIFNHNRKLEILEKEFDLARVANKLESLGYLAESGGKDGQSLLEKLATQLAKNTESVLSLQEEFTDFVSGEELQEQIDHLKAELHSVRELWHHRTSVEILQQENTELKMQLANLSENFDCLNNTVTEIMKREAIRDRGITIPCPSTDEYDKVVEWKPEPWDSEEGPKIYPIVSSIEIVVATDGNGVIGVDGKIPWDCPEDRKFFKELTEGHVVVMGRKTYESLPEKFKLNGLPGRTNIIMSRDEDYVDSMNYETGFDNGSICFTSLKPKAIAGLWKEEANGKIFIIGGEEIYKLWMPYVDVIHCSRIATEINTELASSVAKFEFVDADWGCLVHEVRKGFTYAKLLAMPGCKEG